MDEDDRAEDFVNPYNCRYLTVSAWVVFMMCHESMTVEQCEVIQWAIDHNGDLNVENFIRWKIANNGRPYGAH